jgi:hypothetical protein
MRLRGLGLNFYIHVSVSNLCIPTIGPRQTMNVEIGRQNITYNSVLEIMTPRSFISENTVQKSETDIYIGFSPGPSFVVNLTTCSIDMRHGTKWT